MLKSPLIFGLTLVVALGGGFDAGAVKAAGSATERNRMLSAFATAPSQIMAERTVDGTSFLQDMTESAKVLRSYSFMYETTVFKGNKTINQQGVFYFKQPRLLRVEMTGDYKRGAVAVAGKDGKVRGHLGGALSAFTMTVSPKSDLLVGANGYPMLDSDFAGMTKVMNQFVHQGCKVKVTENPVAVEGETKHVYVLEFYKDGSLYKRAYVDPRSLLPVEWFDYQDGRLYARTVWKNLKLDTDIADAVFQI